jgi:hypothetical protein
MNQIHVSNIGTVYVGDDAIQAQRDFDDYSEQSRLLYGRAAGETVTWFLDDNIKMEYIGTIDTAGNESSLGWSVVAEYLRQKRRLD